MFSYQCQKTSILLTFNVGIIGIHHLQVSVSSYSPNLRLVFKIVCYVDILVHEGLGKAVYLVISWKFY